ncbi:MAG: nitroreductase family protein, partial [Alphaproteobacteria bacterium]|nr:nitroreductase family protein [Alphaproteobacteria bacterium]
MDSTPCSWGNCTLAIILRWPWAKGNFVVAGATIAPAGEKETFVNTVSIPSTDIGLFEAMYTARSLRHFKPDPVPAALIERVLDAAIRASSGGNTQHWTFIVVRDAEKRRQLGALYRKRSEEHTSELQ